MLWPSLPTRILATSSNSSTRSTSTSRTRDVVTGVLIGSAVTYLAFRYWPTVLSSSSSSKGNDDDDDAKQQRSSRTALTQPKRIMMNNHNKNSRSIRNGAAAASESDVSVDNRGSPSSSAPQSPTTITTTTSTTTTPSFLTDIIEQLWDYIKIAGADMIRETVEPSFADCLPPPMNNSCRFIKIDLGSVPITMDNIQVHERNTNTNNTGYVQFDMDVVWDGECDIQLKADYIGSFGVKQLKLSGRMTIVLKPLTGELPIVSSVQYAFINPPDIQLRFSGLASVAEWSNILETSVKRAIQSSLSMVVLPNRKLYKVNNTAANNYLDTYQPPVGVARVHLESGRGFVIEKRLLVADDIPDVYLNVSLGDNNNNSGGVYKTKTIRDHLNPTWNNEHADFCLYDLGQELTIHAWDEDSGPLDPDDDLGIASVVLGNILLAPKRRMELPLLLNNQSSQQHKQQQETGAFVTVSCDLCHWTSDLTSLSIPSSSLSSSSSSPKRINNNNNDDTTRGVVDASSNDICGLLVVIVNRAFDLPLSRKEASTFVKVTITTTLLEETSTAGSNKNNNNKKKDKKKQKTFESKIIYDYPGWDSLNPMYDSAFTIPIRASDLPLVDGSSNRFGGGGGGEAFVQLDLIQQSNSGGMKNNNQTTTTTTSNTILGSTTVTLRELKGRPDNTLTERRRMGDYGASLEFRVSLSGVVVPNTTNNNNNNTKNNSVTVAPATSSPTRPLPPSPSKKKTTNNNNNNNNNKSPDDAKKLHFDDSVVDTETAETSSTVDDDDDDESIGQVKVTVVSGRGLKIQEELFNIDVPDVYCKVSLFDSSDNTDDDGQSWTTTVKYNTVTPSWNESQTFQLMDHGQIITVNAWDKNEREYNPDVEIGSAKTTVGKLLLAGGSMELEMKQKDGRPSGVYIQIRCDMVE